jgi:predicted alpha/beta superfamily hydrolase
VNVRARVSQSLVHDIGAVSSGLGYRLKIWTPPDPAPPGGWPVLWVLDGLGFHGLATDAVRSRGTLGGEIAPALVVSVSHPSDDLAVCLTRRVEDFTAAPPPSAASTDDSPGGLDAFLDMIEQQALPFVAAQFPIDRRRMALYGHSLGGAAVLHALFTRPAMFQSWLAFSPSIHWCGRAVLVHEPGFAAAVRSGRVAPRVFLAVGGLEQSLPRHPAPGMTSAEVAELAGQIAALRMVDEAAELAARLQALPGAAGYVVQWLCPPEETHLSVPFALFGRALDLAFGPDLPPPSPCSR